MATNEILARLANLGPDTPIIPAMIAEMEKLHLAKEATDAEAPSPDMQRRVKACSEEMGGLAFAVFFSDRKIDYKEQQAAVYARHGLTPEEYKKYSPKIRPETKTRMLTFLSENYTSAGAEVRAQSDALMRAFVSKVGGCGL